MNCRRTSWNMVVMMIAIMGVGFLLNIDVLFPFKNENFVQRGWVKAITISENGHCRKLNVVQQGEMLRLLNDGSFLADQEVSQLSDRQPCCGIDRMVIQRFARSEIELLPSGSDEGRMVFVVHGWEGKTCLLQANKSQFQQILLASKGN